MTNTEIAEQFTLLAQLLEIQGENPFKIKSYSKAADVIEEYPKGIVTIDDTELYQIKGIGQAIGEKIRELQHTGEMKALQQVLAIVPPGIVEMLKVKGLSPKKIATIWKALEIETLDQLDEACTLNRIAPVKGFGDKTQATILDAIRFYKRSLGFYRLATIMPFANELVTMLQAAHPENKLELTGDYRRQMETLETIEVVTDLRAKDIGQLFASIEDVALSDAIDGAMLVQLPGKPPLLFHLAAKEDFYAQLFTTCGSEAFIDAFKDQFSIPQHLATEEEIFARNGLQFIHPALREGAAILKQATNNELPKLITDKDIKGVIHAHSKYSDGKETLETMAKTVRDLGYEYFVITDHSQAAFYAEGMRPDEIIAQHQEIDKLNRELHPFKIFKGIEADILSDGSLDYNEAVRDSFDVVVASVHSNLNMSGEKATKRLLAAIKNPHTRVLGHPTGRQLLIREGYPIDHKTIIDACIEHSVVIEINANPRRLDLDWRWVDYALTNGALLSINPDAHSIKGIADLHYGVLAAQKGGLTAKDNLSSFSLQQFEEFLKTRKRH